ncbi:MAG TPA: medium chain dehydrogenase/reductase family protein [Myxococcaceae bacterium]|nr:medium chain dehydrogenase/reductase family protein [Myxococcaceae bacterium]
MKSLIITRHGGPEVLAIAEAPDPHPAPGEVRIQVQRAGLNFSDIAARVGLYPDAPAPPCAVGYEVSGTVDATGDGVSSFRRGDRVLALTRFGGQADRVVVPQSSVFRLPDAMSFDQGAALPVTYLTAFHILFHVHVLRPREKILIHMAAGGVGRAAIELCRLVEGVEIFGTASAAKHPTLREWGVHHPIDYRATDYVEVVKRLTSGRGVDLVLDPLGGPDTAKNYELLASVGHLVCFGWANMVSGTRRNYLRLAAQLARVKRFTPLSLMDHNRTVSGVNIGHLWGEIDLLRGHMRRLLELFEQGRIAPHVDRVFPLSSGADAHRYMQERRNVGKILFDCTR